MYRSSRKRPFTTGPNGLRKDVAQFVADLKPAFMRWPGGCIVEGLTMENRDELEKYHR